MLRKMNLMKDKPIDVVNYIYQADPEMFQFIFGDEITALTSMAKLMRMPGNAFSYQYLYLYYEEEKLLGCISAFNPKDIDSKREWKEMSSVLKTTQQFRMVYVQYFLKNITDLSKVKGIYIQTVSIDMRYRGKGVGSKMIREFIAQQDSSVDIYLDASISKPAVQRFYHHLGFRIVEKLEVPMTEDGVIRMKLESASTL